MFYQGTLQDGISTAVGQQKLVLCFVTDEGEESTLWETDFLTDEALTDLIKDQSIALRLKAGSEEAGYLAQIFPLPRTPTIVIIKNGDLKEYITPETKKDDFIKRIQTAFSAPTHSSSTTQPTSTSQTESPAAATSAQNPPSSSSNMQPETSDSVRRILAERAARLQAEKAEAERKAKEDRARAAAKAKAEAEAGADTQAAAAHKQQEAVKKRRQQEHEERRRILKRIEDDKAERRMRAAEREQMRIDGITTGDVAASLVNAPESKLPSTTRFSEMTAIQVRLFDGSTLRTRFKTSSPLKDIRTWVDQNRSDGTDPFTFKQVLTPLPNKNLDETEESKALGELGLSPSSTLVLIPVQKYTSAYDAPGNILSRFFLFFYGILGWLFGLFSSGGGRGSAEVSNNDAQDAGRASQERDRRIHRFENPDDRRPDQQLYNGNSLNFEPRRDDDEKEE